MYACREGAGVRFQRLIAHNRSYSCRTYASVIKMEAKMYIDFWKHCWTLT